MSGDAPHPYGPELAYLDHLLTDSDEAPFFDTLHKWVGIALEHPDGIQHSSIYIKKDAETGEVERGSDDSDFVDRICEVSGRKGRKRISGELHTLKRLGAFLFITIDGEQRAVVPRWTSQWHEERKDDQKFFRDLIQSMWFRGEEWALLYTMRHLLAVIPKDSNSYPTKSEIWIRLQRRYNYHTNPTYKNARIGFLLDLLLRGGLVTITKDGGYRKTKVTCRALESELCPLTQAETIWQGGSLDFALREALEQETDPKKALASTTEYSKISEDLFSKWSAASIGTESRKKSRRGRKKLVNDALTKIQLLIWGGKYKSTHKYQSKKRLQHPLNQTPWPQYRTKSLPDETWDKLDLGDIRSATLTNIPRKAEWAKNDYQEEVAKLLGVERDDDPLFPLNWGPRNGFRIIDYLRTLNSVEEKVEICRLPLPEIRRRLIDTNLDPSRSAHEYPEDFEFYEWQEEASQQWHAGDWAHGEKGADRAGIVEVVTGAGKTVLGVKLINEFLLESPENKALVIVPTEVLLYQWREELTKYLNVGSDVVSLIGDNNTGSFDQTEHTRIIIGIVNSLALEHVKERLDSGDGYPDPGSLFVIADECHRYRGEKFRRVLKWHIRDGDPRLGLSATPLAEKDDVDVGDIDDEKPELIVSGILGKPSYWYGYVRARDDELIPRFKVKLVGFNLTNRERSRYDKLSKKISRAVKKIDDNVGHRLSRMRGSFDAKINKLRADGVRVPGAKDYHDAVRARKDLLSFGFNERGLEERQQAFEHILLDRAIREENIDTGKKENTDKKVLVFQERIQEIMGAMYPSSYKRGDGTLVEPRIASLKHYKPGSVHSKRSPDRRNVMTLDLLRRGALNVVFSARQLDEGLDVPAVDVGLIRIPTRSLRRMIQRLGRILRSKEGKERSDFYILYANGTTEMRLFESEEFRKRLHEDSIEYWSWDEEMAELIPQNKEDAKTLWGGQVAKIEWNQLNIGDPVRVKVVGGQFSVSSQWIPFVKEKAENGGEVRRRISNLDYVEVASVMKEMNKPGTVYHDEEGHCVTYRRGKGGTYVGKVSPNKLEMTEYPINLSRRGAQPLIRAQKGSNLARILDLLGANEEE